MDLKNAIAAALSAGVFVTLPVTAADSSSNSVSRERADQIFTTLDTNKDGDIDQAEAAATPWLKQSFSQYDNDHNGKLGKDEFAAAASSQPAASLDASAAAGASSAASLDFDSLDKSKDGNIDATEAQANSWLQQNFGKYDMDHDGKLGKDEFAAARKAQPQ